MANPKGLKAETQNNETVSTSVRLSAKMREAFEAIAEEERRTLANVLRNALEDWLDGRGKQ